MVTQNEPEFWQQGPVQGIAPLLQPAAHAFLQARKEVEDMMNGFPDHLLWKRPAGLASAGFHLRHLSGVIDRLFTYAKALPLTQEQLNYLQNEGIEDAAVTVSALTNHFRTTIDAALAQLSSTPENSLTEARTIGRKQIPTTVIGLLFHAAEHTQRHTGQLIVTVEVVRSRQIESQN